MEFNANANNSSAVNLAIACSEPLDGNDSLFSITFQGQGSGNSALGVTLYHLNEGNSPCTAIDASITVTDCALDVDGSGLAPDAGTDGAYTVRHLFGLPPVPQSFRENDPTIPSDAVIGANIDAIGSMLDVDNRGGSGRGNGWCVHHSRSIRPTTGAAKLP